MKIAIFNVDNLHSDSPISKLEPFADPTPWLLEHEWERFYISKKQYEAQIEEILINQYNVIINLCDGALGDDRPGIDVVKLLERLNIPFTGASSDFYEPSRNEMKKACEKKGVRFPKGMELNSFSEKSKLDELCFPLIVKHPNSYNSIGLTRNSVVKNKQDLHIEIEKMIQKFDGALVEEYIDGPEYTALVVGNSKISEDPIVFNPMEIIFPQGETFKHFDLKWSSHVTMKYKQVSNIEISDKIKEMSSAMFQSLNGSGYARCDLRMNRNGELFMLEINPNCSIYFPKNDPSSADEILFSIENGHKMFTEQILKNAFSRSSIHSD